MYGQKAQKLLAQGSGRKQHALKGRVGRNFSYKDKNTIFDFFKWTQINSFTYLMAPIISCTDEQP